MMACRLESSAPKRPADLAFMDMPYLFSFIFGFRIYSDMADQQDLAFKLIHIEAKSINIWLRYDPKQNTVLIGYYDYLGTWPKNSHRPIIVTGQ